MPPRPERNTTRDHSGISHAPLFSGSCTSGSPARASRSRPWPRAFGRKDVGVQRLWCWVKLLVYIKAKWVRYNRLWAQWRHARDKRLRGGRDALRESRIHLAHPRLELATGAYCCGKEVAVDGNVMRGIVSTIGKPGFVSGRVIGQVRGTVSRARSTPTLIIEHPGTLAYRPRTGTKIRGERRLVWEQGSWCWPRNRNGTLEEPVA